MVGSMSKISEPPRSPRGIVTLLGEQASLTARVACVTSRCHLDACLLPPDPEGLVTRTAVLIGGHQVPPRTEVAVDHGVG